MKTKLRVTESVKPILPQVFPFHSPALHLQIFAVSRLCLLLSYSCSNSFIHIRLLDTLTERNCR